MHRDFEISAGTAEGYEDYIADVRFPNRGGFIVSQEKSPGEFEISLHSFIPNQERNYDYCRNIEEAKIPYATFRRALDIAISELERLRKES